MTESPSNPEAAIEAPDGQMTSSPDKAPAAAVLSSEIQRVQAADQAPVPDDSIAQEGDQPLDPQVASPTSPTGECSYDVGYRRPPKASRFSKGQSGNPGGRPKGAKNSTSTEVQRLRDIVIEEGNRQVTIRGENGPEKIPVMRAVVRSLAVKAAQGAIGSQRLYLQITNAAQTEMNKEVETAIRNGLRYQIRMRGEIEYRKRHNLPPNEYIPHPDHMEIDPGTETVVIRGPVNEADKQDWDRLFAELEKLSDYIAELSSALSELPEGFVDDDGFNGWAELESAEFTRDLTHLTIMKRWSVKACTLTEDHEYAEWLTSWSEVDEWPPIPEAVVELMAQEATGP